MAAEEVKEVVKTEEGCGCEEQACELQTVQAAEPTTTTTEEAKPEEKKEESPLTKLLKSLREKNASKEEKAARITLKDKGFRHKFQLNINNTDAVTTLGEVIAAVYILTERDEPGKKKVTLEDVIRKGDECPCAKHTAFRAAAFYIQSGWTGRA